MVKGTGPDDRITAKDVESFVVSGPPTSAMPVAAPVPVAAPAMAPPGMPAAAYEDIPLGNIRAVSYLKCLPLRGMLNELPLISVLIQK